MTAHSPIPIVSIELQGIKQRVSAMFQDHSDELGRFISAELEEQLSEEWVLNMVRDTVTKAITQAIEATVSDYHVQYSLKKLIVNHINSTLEKINAET